MIEHENILDSVTKGEVLLFRTIWNNSSDNMFIVRQDENGDFINESCNRSQEKIFGFTPNQVNGVNLKELLEEDVYTLISNRYNQCISLNKPITYQEAIILDESGERYFNTTILPIKDDESTRIFGISREITELLRKEQEKLLLEQTKNAQMAEMIDNISHQWRQPLSAISTAASYMKVADDMGISQKDEDRKMLDNILEHAEYLSNTLDMFKNNILEQKNYKEIILQESVNNAINVVSASLKNSDIEFIYNIKSSEPIKIKMLAGKFSNVIVNLLNNAKDALLRNKIKHPFIKLELMVENNDVIITVEDNAGGIKKEIIPKIFDLYFTTKHQSQGTGLGLYMSKNLIEKDLKGTINAQNTKEGVVFTIKIPLINE